MSMITRKISAGLVAALAVSVSAEAANAQGAALVRAPASPDNGLNGVRCLDPSPRRGYVALHFQPLIREV